MADFAVLHHAAHQGIGVVGDMEPLGRKAGSKAGRAQHPYRVFGEGGGHVPQHTVIQIVHTLVRVDQLSPGGFFGHGVNGQVPAQQVLLKSDAGICAGFKAGIAVPRFTFGARQCVLFLTLRVQKYGEVLADRLVTQIQHVLWCCADHHPVAFLYRQPEAGVPYRTADQVNFHCPQGLT